MANFPLFQREPAKQFQIVALVRSFLSETDEKNIFRMANFPLFQKETGFFDRKREKNRRKKNIFRMANFPLFQKEPAKQFQIVALARSFLSAKCDGWPGI